MSEYYHTFLEAVFNFEADSTEMIFCISSFLHEVSDHNGSMKVVD